MFICQNVRMLTRIVKDFSLLEKKLNIKFDNQNFLIQAFVHRSFLNENPGFHLSNNERLEFLGDAVLELVVTDYLYKKYPEKAEGELTNWRASLVNAKILLEVAEDLGFNDFLLLSRGEGRELGKARQYILADTLEAFIGGLYLDQGYEPCRNFIEKYLIVKLPRIIKTGAFEDSKSRFQEKAQGVIGVTPGYKVLKQSGPDHNKRFVVGAFLKEDLVAKGEGSSKQEAEEDAAKIALEINNWKTANNKINKNQ